MRIVVDGATGLVGRATRAALAAHEVVATDHPDHPGVSGDVRPCDLLRDDPRPILEGADVYVHVAGLFELDAPLTKLRAVNVEGTRRALQAAVDVGVRRVVHVSSVTVYGTPRRAVTESAAFAPRSPYERTKAEGDAVARGFANQLEVIVARPSGVYGPDARAGLAHLLALHALAAHDGRAGGLRPYVGGPRMNFAHADNVGSALAFLCEHGRPGAYHVAEPDPVAWGDLMSLARRLTGADLGPERRLSNLEARALALTWRHLPASRRERVNASVSRRWARLVDELGLEDALRPRIERYAYDYWRGDHVYDVGKLLRAGWHPPVEDTLEGLATTHAALVDRAWLP